MKFADRVMMRDTLVAWLARCEAGVQIAPGPGPVLPKIIQLLKDDKKDPAESPGPPPPP